MNQAESILNGLKPDLYRINAFRLTQLEADAAQRDISRRLEKLTMQAKLDAAPAPVRGPLALIPPPDLEMVRAAVQRLTDPEIRFIDEFFWFWRESPGADAPDVALDAIRAGDVASARKLWQEQTTNPTAPHNLAVLNHLLALDFEHRTLTNGRVLDNVLCRMRDQAWADAWKNWRIALQQAVVWDRLRQRLAGLNEPQLQPALADELRRALPVALLSLNAQLAVIWAERRLPREADRHKQLMAQSGLDSDDANEAFRRALRPVRERLKTLCESGGHEGWQAAVDLFKGVSSLPSRDTDLANLLEDAGPALYKVCWFCQKQPSDPAIAAVVPMHGRVTRTKTANGESLHWDRLFVEVPRCWQCSQAHQRWQMLYSAGAAPVGVRPESDKTAFPFVARHLADGWGLGATPDGF
jgi:hypothetical protein